MPPIEIPQAQPGVAHFELSDDYVNTHILNGEHPALSPAISAISGAAIERWQVVGYDASGNIVPATWDADPADAIQAIGVATNAVTATNAITATAAGERVLYWYAGHFNLSLLVFDATFDTEAKRLAAFAGSPNPSQLRVSSR